MGYGNKEVSSIMKKQEDTKGMLSVTPSGCRLNKRKKTYPHGIHIFVAGEQTLKPRVTDVVLGRGNGVARTPGNKSFRSLVWRYKSRYLACRGRMAKVEIARKVMQQIANLNPPGRFLEPMVADYNGKAKYFTTVADDKAYEKICQALREKKNHCPDDVLDDKPLFLQNEHDSSETPEKFSKQDSVKKRRMNHQGSKNQKTKSSMFNKRQTQAKSSMLKKGKKVNNVAKNTEQDPSSEQVNPAKHHLILPSSDETKEETKTVSLRSTSASKSKGRKKFATKKGMQSSLKTKVKDEDNSELATKENVNNGILCNRIVLNCIVNNTEMKQTQMIHTDTYHTEANSVTPSYQSETSSTKTCWTSRFEQKCIFEAQAPVDPFITTERLAHVTHPKDNIDHGNEIFLSFDSISKTTISETKDIQEKHKPLVATQERYATVSEHKDIKGNVTLAATQKQNTQKLATSIKVEQEVETQVQSSNNDFFINVPPRFKSLYKGALLNHCAEIQKISTVSWNDETMYAPKTPYLLEPGNKAGIEDLSPLSPSLMTMLTDAVDLDISETCDSFCGLTYPESSEALKNNKWQKNNHDGKLCDALSSKNMNFNNSLPPLSPLTFKETCPLPSSLLATTTCNEYMQPLDSEVHDPTPSQVLSDSVQDLFSASFGSILNDCVTTGDLSSSWLQSPMYDVITPQKTYSVNGLTDIVPPQNCMIQHADSQNSFLSPQIHNVNTNESNHAGQTSASYHCGASDLDWSLSPPLLPLIPTVTNMPAMERLPPTCNLQRKLPLIYDDESPGRMSLVNMWHYF